MVVRRRCLADFDNTGRTPFHLMHPTFNRVDIVNLRDAHAIEMI